MGFTEDQQLEGREECIREYRQKTWSTRWHASWMSKDLGTVIAEGAGEGSLKSRSMSSSPHRNTTQWTIITHARNSRRHVTLWRASYTLLEKRSGNEGACPPIPDCEAALQLAEPG